MPRGPPRLGVAVPEAVSPRASRWPSSATPARSGTPRSAPTAAGSLRRASTTRSSSGTSPPGELERTLRGHKARAYSVGFDKEGTRLVSASADRTAIIWDVASGKALHVLRGHDDNVRCAAFSLDGHTVVTGSWDGSISASGTRGRASCLGHSTGAGWITRVAFSPDRAWVAVGGIVGPGGGLGHLRRPRLPDVRWPIGAHPERRLQPRRLADRHDAIMPPGIGVVQVWDVLTAAARSSRTRSARA